MRQPSTAPVWATTPTTSAGVARFLRQLGAESAANVAALDSLATIPAGARGLPPHDRAMQLLPHNQLARSVWLARLQGVAHERPNDWFPAWSTDLTREACERNDAAWGEWLASLGESDMARTVRYVSSEGQAYRNRVDDVLIHVFNHSTYHRGQLARLVTECGGLAASTDYEAPAGVAPPPVEGVGSVARFRRQLEAEIWADRASLESLATVPSVSRSLPRFERAMRLLPHNQLARSVWLARLKQVSHERPADWFPSWTAERTLEACDRNDREWGEHLASLADAEVSRTIRYVTGDGQSHEIKVEDVLIHVFNHSTYHRGQLTRLVTVCGGRRASTDYIVFTRVKE
ncbi:MAG: DinB family protein [Phycisphaerae bacterium]